jgi:glycerate-2-kinase
MSHAASGIRAWLPVTATAAMLALGIVACGGSNGDGDDGEATASQPSQDSNDAAERRAAATVMTRLRKAYNAADAEGYCSNITKHGQDEMVRAARKSGQGGDSKTCTELMTVVGKFVKSTKYAQEPVKTKQVVLHGDKADVTIQGGAAGFNDLVTYKLAKENDAWKLENPIAAEATRKSHHGR